MTDPIRSNWDGAPIWFKAALHEIGIHEVGDNRGPDVARYCAAAHVPDKGWPWCDIFMCAMLELNGIPSPRSASSHAVMSDPNFVKLAGPALGAIQVFWRQSRQSGLGHVNFYRAETADRVCGVGGNQSDSVSMAWFPKKAGAFGLIGYWWPKSVALPKIGAISINPATPLVASSGAGKVV